jgi:hypothetical protein
VALLALAAILVLNREYYAWFVRRRGWAFTTRVVPAHVLYHLNNGISFVAGTLIHLAARFGLQLPGALPTTPWPATSDSGNPAARSL